MGSFCVFARAGNALSPFVTLCNVLINRSRPRSGGDAGDVVVVVMRSIALPLQNGSAGASPSRAVEQEYYDGRARGVRRRRVTADWTGGSANGALVPRLACGVGLALALGGFAERALLQPRQ